MINVILLLIGGARKGVFPLLVGFCLFPLSALAGDEADSESQAFLDRLEWRGILVLPGETRFSFHDKASQQSFWISKGRVRNGIKVVGYDSKDERVTLKRGSAERILSLNQATVQELDENQIAESPAVTIVEGKEVFAEKEDAEEVEISEDAGEFWAAAVARSGQLREIEQQFHKINAEEAVVLEALSNLDSDEPAYRRLAERSEAIEEQRRFLTEGAVGEIGETDGLSDDQKSVLTESFQGGFSRQLQPPESSDRTSAGEIR